MSVSTLGRVAQSTVSALLFPVTAIVGAVATVTRVADDSLRRAIDSIPTVTEEVVIEMAREDPEMKRNIELWQAARDGEVKEVDRLLAEGADVNYVESTKNEFNHDHNYWTPLHIAAQNGHAEVVKLLFAAGADRNFMSTFIRAQSGLRQKWTALHAAASQGHAGVVRAFIEHSTIACKPEDQVPTPLPAGARSRVLNINQQSNEARFDQRSYVTGTALFRAAMAGRAEVVRILIDAGSDATIMNYKRKTPLHSACEHGHRDVVTVLINYGTDVCTQAHLFQEDSDGSTAMALAEKNGHSHVIRHLFPLHRVWWHDLTQRCCPTDS